MTYAICEPRAYRVEYRADTVGDADQWAINHLKSHYWMGSLACIYENRPSETHTERKPDRVYRWKPATRTVEIEVKRAAR